MKQPNTLPGLKEMLIEEFGFKPDDIIFDKMIRMLNLYFQAELSKVDKSARIFNRIEVIDHTQDGTCDYVKWQDDNFKVTESVQDDGRTLKIFLEQLTQEDKGEK